MRFLREQDMVKTYRNREFDSGCIPMNYGARVAIRRLSCFTSSSYYCFV